MVEAFEALMNAIVLPPEAADVDYFEDTWIGHPQHRERRALTFVVQQWNCRQRKRRILKPNIDVSTGTFTQHQLWLK